MVYSNPRFTIIDDEAQSLSRAAQPVSAIVKLAGSGLQWHPPIYDLLLHAWLLVTGGVFEWLRVPFILCFLCGLWLLSRAARRIGGPASGTALIWLGAMWPNGFHYGRLAAWYAPACLVVSAQTFAYLRFCDQPSSKAWRAVWLLGLVLVYTNYLGWVVLVMLGVDDWIRHRSQPGTGRRLAVSAALLLIAYAPLWPGLLRALAQTHAGQTWRAMGLNLGFNVYALLVSESVAPWYWRFGVPATLAVAACWLLVFFRVRWDVRRFLLFSALLTVSMALTGALDTKHLILVAPWFLLPMAVAVGTAGKPLLRGALAVSLLVAGGIGWYGIYSRQYYAAPRFLEPWAQIANEAAVSVRDGSALIGNNPSFFFYLTYALKDPVPGAPWRFKGALPYDAHFENVWAPEQWIASGAAIPPRILWVRGMSGPDGGKPMADAAARLDHECEGERTVRFLAHDPGYDLKQRYFPQMGELAWRVETRAYDCSQQVAKPAPVPAPAPAGQ